MNRKFNLIDEPWIPIEGVGCVGLRQLFMDSNLRALHGTPTEKIAITKFLLAVVQAAWTPEDDQEWQSGGMQELCKQCLAYLETWHHTFDLYGEKPFLQMPMVKKSELKHYGDVMTEVATGNTTCLTQYHMVRPLKDPQKVLILLIQMSLALGGKKVDNSVVLSPGYVGKNNDKGKPSSGKPGPAIAYMGLLHSFAMGKDIQETLWLNVLTQENIGEIGLFPGGVGTAPWESMPKGEDCPVARALKGSLMGRLLPLCRFCFLSDDGLHLTEGLQHHDYKDGMFDPSITISYTGKKVRVIWTDPERRPWRRLPAMLGFISQSHGTSHCFQLKYSLAKASRVSDRLGIWSGGLKVSSNAGEQYVTGKDGALESLLFLPVEETTQALWFEHYTLQLAALEKLSQGLYTCVNLYFREFKDDRCTDHAAKALHTFWQLCEQQAQQLIDVCDEHEAMSALRMYFSRCVYHIYDLSCPHQTAKQLCFWAKHRPNIAYYLKKEKEVA